MNSRLLPKNGFLFVVCMSYLTFNTDVSRAVDKVKVIDSINLKRNELNTSKPMYALNIVYQTQHTNFYKPISIDNSRTTALVESQKLFKTDKNTGIRTPITFSTSYSENLKLAYEVQKFAVEATFMSSQSRIVQVNEGRPLNYSVTSGTVFSGPTTISLCYDGSNSKALFEQNNVISGVPLKSGLQKSGDKISFNVIDPLHCYAFLADVNKATLESSGTDVLVKQGRRAYLISSEYGAIKEVREERPQFTYIVRYSDFRSSGNSFYLPWNVTEIMLASDGKLISERIANFSKLTFLPKTDVDRKLCSWEFPQGTTFESNGTVESFLLRHN